MGMLHGEKVRRMTYTLQLANEGGTGAARLVPSASVQCVPAGNWNGTAGADDTEVLQAAIDACKVRGGGVIELDPFKSHRFTQLDLRGTRNITIRTPLAMEGLAAMSPQPATLVCTAAGSASAILAGHSVNLRLLGLGIRYSSAAYTGKLIDLDTRGVGSDTAYFAMRHCALGGISSLAKNAATLVSLDGVIVSSIKRCSFEWADRAIVGPSFSWCNVLRLEGNVYRFLNLQSVYNIGSAWTLDGEAFEPNVGNICAFIDGDDGSNGLATTIRGCWMGDVNLGANYCIRGKFLGLHVVNNYIGINAVGSGCISLKAGSEGVIIEGNRMEATNGVRAEGQYAFHVTCRSNSWQVTNQVVNPLFFNPAIPVQG